MRLSAKVARPQRMGNGVRNLAVRDGSGESSEISAAPWGGEGLLGGLVEQPANRGGHPLAEPSDDVPTVGHRVGGADFLPDRPDGCQS